MQVRVLFFGVLKDLAGKANDTLSLPDNATLGDVLIHYEQTIPRLKETSASLAMSVNQEYAEPGTKLISGDEVALLPPVSGGTDEASLTKRSPHAAIVRERIETDSILQRIKQPEDGAATIFEGVVRNNTRGRRTLYLDYEAYEDMALKRMEGLADRALAEFKIRDLAIVHRLGRLEIGETSILIVVASAHRGPAFEACRWLIDSVKRTVPIWKKEHFEDGAVWADGEAFPDDIADTQGTHSIGSASN
jgi:molybdopterin converting factor subunit 1